MTDDSQIWQHQDSFIYLLMPEGVRRIPEGFRRGEPQMKNRVWAHFHFDSTVPSDEQDRVVATALRALNAPSSEQTSKQPAVDTLVRLRQSLAGLYASDPVQVGPLISIAEQGLAAAGIALDPLEAP